LTGCRLWTFRPGGVEVFSFLTHIALVGLHAAEYSIEQALWVPVVQHRVAPNVHPSSNILETGLPTVTTPTTLLPSLIATPNFQPCGGW